MAVTLSKVMARAWRELGHLTDLQATGGSATTIVSTYSPFTSDDALNNGTAIVIRDAGGAGAAPEGEFSVITDYVASTKTWTIDALSTGVASGDLVGLAKPTIRLQQMKQAVNDGVAGLGTISLVDTSITLATDTYQYNLPVGLKIKDLKDVLYIDDNGKTWSIKGLVRDFPAAPAATGVLEFSSIPGAYTLWIEYEGVHQTLNAYSNTVSETIQEELAVAATIDKALTWLVSKRGESALNTFLLQRWNDAKNTLQVQKFEKPVHRAKSKQKFFIWNG